MGESARKHPGTPIEKPNRIEYSEDIYLGYRYYLTFNEKVSYPFGYGLSYTTFEYSNIKLKENEDKFEISVDIKNIGEFNGKEVVQLYISAPTKKLKKPLRELKRFYKTDLINPNNKEHIDFTLTMRDLASFDTTQDAWFVEKGNYIISIGSSSTDIKLTKIITIKEDKIIEKVNNVVKPENNFPILSY